MARTRAQYSPTGINRRVAHLTGPGTDYKPRGKPRAYTPRGWAPVFWSLESHFGMTDKLATTCKECGAVLYVEGGPRCEDCRRAKRKARRERARARHRQT